MARLILAVLCVIVTTPVVCQQAHGTESEKRLTLRLWPDGPPGVGTSAKPEKTVFADSLVGGRSVSILGPVTQPNLTLYLPAQRKTQDPQSDARSLPAIVVFPGGGYNILAIDLEGTEVCAWLNHIGIACVLVKYRVPDTGPYPKSDAALQDAQRALGIVREHATDWRLDPKRIGVLGFSAGGHLIAALASHSEQRLYPTIDTADKVSCRPDFDMLIYPAYLSQSDGSLELSAAVQPTANTPPTFLVQTEDDHVPVENAIAYFVGLKHAGVAAEMHLYAEGGHGYGLRPTALPVTGWPAEAEKWLHSIKVLP